MCLRTLTQARSRERMYLLVAFPAALIKICGTCYFIPHVIAASLFPVSRNCFYDYRKILHSEIK